MPRPLRKNYDEAVRRYREGARLVDLAKEYGLTRVGMYLNLKARGITDFRDDRKKLNVDEAIELYKNGMLMKDIAEKFGCTVSAVSLAFNKKGDVPTPRNGLNPFEISRPSEPVKPVKPVESPKPADTEIKDTKPIEKEITDVEVVRIVKELEPEEITFTLGYDESYLDNRCYCGACSDCDDRMAEEMLNSKFN